jgi:hypothetical protein
MLTTAYATGTTTSIFPSKGVHGTCIDCGEEVISKCGPINADHFAHKPGANCNTRFHDNKSEWHIRWQHTINPTIPGENVEVTIKSNDLVKRADMINKANYVVEFQHSHLPLDERLEREEHYKNMIWVVHKDRVGSRTWKKRRGGITRVFFNGDDDRILWVSDTVVRDPDIGMYFRNCGITKDHFIKTVINNPRYNTLCIRVMERRWARRVEALLVPMSAAFEFLNGEYEKIEQIEKDRKERIAMRDPKLLLDLLRGFSDYETYDPNCYHSRWIKHTEFSLWDLNRMRMESELKARMGTRDPQELFELLNMTSSIVAEREHGVRNGWMWVSRWDIELEFLEHVVDYHDKTELTTRDPQPFLEVLNRNADDENAALQANKHEWLKSASRDLECQCLDRLEEHYRCINEEITRKQTATLDKETEERIRIDLLRIKGTNQEAAEAARERLKHLGVVTDPVGETA